MRRHHRHVAGVDLVDETFIVAQPAVLIAGIVADPQMWRRVVADLQLAVFMDRGLLGQRWSMTGALVGSLEIWIEPIIDGCIVHHYLRGEPSSDGRTPNRGRTPAGWRRAAGSALVGRRRGSGACGGSSATSRDRPAGGATAVVDGDRRTCAAAVVWP